MASFLGSNPLVLMFCTWWIISYFVLHPLSEMFRQSNSVLTGTPEVQTRLNSHIFINIRQLNMFSASAHTRILQMTLLEIRTKSRHGTCTGLDSGVSGTKEAASNYLLVYLYVAGNPIWLTSFIHWMCSFAWVVCRGGWLNTMQSQLGSFGLKLTMCYTFV